MFSSPLVFCAASLIVCLDGAAAKFFATLYFLLCTLRNSPLVFCAALQLACLGGASTKLCPALSSLLCLYMPCVHL